MHFLWLLDKITDGFILSLVEQINLRSWCKSGQYLFAKLTIKLRHIGSAERKCCHLFYRNELKVDWHTNVQQENQFYICSDIKEVFHPVLKFQVSKV